MKIINGKKAYPTKCSECGHEFYAAKSILHEMGEHEFGGGTCNNCNTFLNLQFDEKNQKMISQRHDKWIIQLKGAKNK